MVITCNPSEKKDGDEKEIVNSLPFDPLINEKYREQLEAGKETMKQAMPGLD